MSSMTGAAGYGGGNKIPKGYEAGQMQQFTPEQMNLFKSMFSQVGPDSMTAKLAGGDQSMFDQMEAPAMRQFQGMQGQMASRFSGMGMGARKGSGFKNTMNQASSDFAQDLQSKRMGLQQQAIKDLMGMSSDLLGQRPYENFMVEKDEPEKPWWQSLIAGAAPIVGGIAGGVFGGPAGAMLGSSLGSAVGGAFSK